MTEDTGIANPVGLQSGGVASLTERVLDSFANTNDERLLTVLRSLVLHLHSFIESVHLTRSEWSTAVEFLTAVGQKCDAQRQELVLLSDVLGVSMLVELLNAPECARDGEVGLPPTLPTVLGPFHMTESPSRERGSTISELGDATPLLVQVSVRNEDGCGLAGATVDVWQCNAEGYYDVQQPGVQPAGNGRGVFSTDDSGDLEFVTVIPSHYPIPTDGPVGSLLQATGRHPWRPAHIHFQVVASGHVGLTTHIFIPGSPYLESDAVFAVRPSLICDLVEETDALVARRYGLPVPFARTEVKLVLGRA